MELWRHGPCLAALLGALAGCAAETEPVAGVWLEVGHGLSRYQRLETGDGVELVLGSQGGWHIDLAALFGGTNPEGHFIVYRVWDPERRAQISYPIKAFVEPDRVTAKGDGSFEQVGIRTVFAIDEPSEVLGKTWLAEAELIVGPDVFVDACAFTVVDEVVP